MDERRWSNLAEARKHYDARDEVTADGPLEAFFEVAAACNLACRMCAINYDTRYQPGSGRPALFSPELFEKLRPMFPTVLRSYLFGLGEPMLNKHLVLYVRTLSEMGSQVWFNSNATLIDEKKADELAEAGATAITVSIDGATKETYEEIRQGARYEDVIRGIRALVAARKKWGRPEVDLSFVAMTSNIAELPELVDLAAGLGVRGVHVEPLFSQNQAQLQEHYSRENLGIAGRARVEDILAVAQVRSRAAGVRLASRFLLGAGDPDYVRRAPELGIWWTCTEPWSSIWVTAAGEIRTCCINETSFGSLHEKAFGEIWNGEDFRVFRRQHAAGSETPKGCGNCIRNGRVRNSPFFEPLEAVTYRPLRVPLAEGAGERSSRSGSLDDPLEGSTATDPLVITGTVARESRRPLLRIDRGEAIPLADVAYFSRGRFVAVLAMPYLTEGAHLVELLDEGENEGVVRKFHFWLPAASESLCVTDRLVVGIHLSGPAVTAIARIDGVVRADAQWFWRGRSNGWRGAVAVDVSDLETGRHELVVEPLGEPAAVFSFVRFGTAREDAPDVELVKPQAMSA